MATDLPPTDNPRDAQHGGASALRPDRATGAAWFWPALVIALLSGQVLLILIMAYVAVSDQSFAVEPDYYQQALHWDAMQAQARVNVALNWQVQIDVGSQADLFRNRDFRCTITDRTGQPVDGASVQLTAFPHARGSQRSRLDLDPQGLGRYGTRLHMPRAGLWEFRLAVTRGEDVFTVVEQIQIDAASGQAPIRHASDGSPTGAPAS